VGRKKLVRKSEPPAKRGIAWPRWTGFRGMTVRAWLELLIIPLALVVAGFLFTAQQDQRQQAIEEQRAERQQELEEERAQDLTLQAYLDQMSTLVLEDLGDPKVRTIARARTLTVLRRLDPSRKAEVMQFLLEADLVNSVGERDPVIELNGANLSGTDLSGADLSGANLRDANLYDVALDTADLSGVDLSGANLSDANLKEADLSDANLCKANLSGANLRNALLNYACLRDANLYDANLYLAHLYGANMKKADLRHASMVDTTLDFANLTNADLRGVTGQTSEELDQHAIFGRLEGATMPNGQKYEDWLKDREKR
jgi:uncharacterized protein YjbI with pentapeptide repeats